MVGWRGQLIGAGKGRPGGFRKREEGRRKREEGRGNINAQGPRLWAQLPITNY